MRACAAPVRGLVSSVTDWGEPLRQPDKLYFRVRENGASVFRVDTENRQRRIEMQQIANVNIRNGQVKPQGDNTPTEDELKEIEAWRMAREDLMVTRQVDDVHRMIDDMNMLAHWVQGKATTEHLDMFTDDLLMAMHDLRSALVRAKAKSLKFD